MPSIPTATDLQSYLTASGLYNAALSSHLQPAIDAAVAAFARLVDLDDPVAIETGTALRHDPGPVSEFWSARQGGSRVLRLLRPCVAIDSVYIGTENDGTGGTEVLEYEGYYTLPREAGTRAKPIRAIEFWRTFAGVPQSIVITARWGLFDEYPRDLWYAILAHAASETLGPMIAQLTAGSGGVKGWTDGDIKKEFADPTGWYFGSGTLKPDSVLGALRGRWQPVYFQFANMDL